RREAPGSECRSRALPGTLNLLQREQTRRRRQERPRALPGPDRWPARALDDRRRSNGRRDSPNDPGREKPPGALALLRSAGGSPTPVSRCAAASYPLYCTWLRWFRVRLGAMKPCLALCLLLSPLVYAAPAIKVLIIDGQNNHKWEETTPILKKDLESTGKFQV